MKRLPLLIGLTIGLLALVPGQAVATAPNNESAIYEYELEVPNTAMAPNGDMIAVTGTGTISVHPKASLSGGGTFTHTFAGGGSVTGTWTALDLLSFQPYGCGVVFGTPIPPNLCGGRILLRVLLTPPAPNQPHEALLWIYCVIGQPPPSAEEGIRMNIPGIVNFNDVTGGDNVYFKVGAP